MKNILRKISNFLQYAVALFFALASLGAFTFSAFSGILVLLSALISCPFTRNKGISLINKFLGNRINIFKVKGWIYGIVVTMLFITGVSISSAGTTSSGYNKAVSIDTNKNTYTADAEQKIEAVENTPSAEEFLEEITETEIETEENTETITHASQEDFIEKKTKEETVISVTETTPPAEEVSAEMEVHFIDVGQGDATLIKADSRYMLIDAGDNTKGSAIWSYLLKQGVNELDYLILTHTDADHIGGADVIVNKFDIKTVFIGDFKKDNNTYRELMDALKYKHLTYRIPEVGSEYSLGNATFTIVAPNRTYSDPNNSSIALVLKNGTNTFLFTGDCEEDAENDILANELNIDCDVYKVGHHGSNTASSKRFLEAITPSYGVISCEEGNSYGHPHAEPLNNLRSMNVQLFRTDEQGSIIAYSNGEEITWNCAPTDFWRAGENTESATLKTKNNTTDDKPKETNTKMAVEENKSPATETEVKEPQILEEPQKQPQTSSYIVIGNVNSKAFHRESCSRLPKEKNRAYFNSREEAMAAGYNNPCDYCTP